MIIVIMINLIAKMNMIIIKIRIQIRFIRIRI